MTKDEAKSMFVAAGIDVLRMWELPNGYWPCPSESPQDDYEKRKFIQYHMLRAKSPWWLVMTGFGLVEIGWRKRVISIDWSATNIRTVVTEDPVTKGESYVHAWSQVDAVKYLNALRVHALELDPVDA